MSFTQFTPLAEFYLELNMPHAAIALAVESGITKGQAELWLNRVRSFYLGD